MSDMMKAPKARTIEELIAKVDEAQAAVRKAQAEKEEAEYDLLLRLITERRDDCLKINYARLHRR